MNLLGLPDEPVSDAALKVRLDELICGRSLRDYIPDAWKSWLVSKKYVHNWHIDAIADHLQAVSERKIRRLIISIAPRSMKSLCTSVFWPTWDWVNRPGTQFVYASYGMHLATRDAVWSRRLMDSKWYQQRWGCRCGGGKGIHEATCKGWRFTTDQNVKTLYENDRGGRRLTASVEAGTTGEGGDILVMDDPIDIQKAHSAQARATATNYFEDVWIGRQNDAATTSCMVVIAQRTHEEDLTGHILATHTGWDHLVLPTEYHPRVQVQMTSIGFKDPRSTAGELLWPARFGPDEVAEAKRRPYTYSAQHDQNPKPAGGGIIKREWVVFWKPKGLDLLPPRDRDGREYRVRDAPDEYEYQCQSWDTSFKDETDAIRKGRDPDPVSGGAWGMQGPDAYLLDRVSGRMDIVQAIQAVRDMSARFPLATAKLIEDKANGPAIRQILRRELTGLIPVTPEGGKVARVMTAAATEGDKDARAMAMVDLFHAGNVLVPHPMIAPWVWDYIEELVSFPNAAHDDDVDMTSQALTHLEQRKWRAQDVAQAEVRRHGGHPPPQNTADVLKHELRKALEREKKPKTNPNPWLRRK